VQGERTVTLKQRCRLLRGEEVVGRGCEAAAAGA
jgi:hypothetical protein